MKKAFVSVALIGLGAGGWWITARSARFSVKNWDAKFETALRHGLSSVGLTDQDILSSFHEIKKDINGEWVTHRVAIKHLSSEKQAELMEGFKKTGATVEEKIKDNAQTWIVKRGSRIYQEVSFSQK